MPRASTVTVSYPEDLSEWGRRQLETRWFMAYLRRTLGTVTVGDEREEFLDVGCCGNTLDVPLRIEAVEGGETADGGTAIEYTARDACGIRGGWRVQSAGGPTTTGPATNGPE